MDSETGDCDQSEADSGIAMTNSKTLGRLALEVFSIVLGVLLALGVSEWQEERQRNERLQTGLANIASEPGSNLQILRISHENNTLRLERP